MAFHQGISGLHVASTAIDVTSNNIANVSTVGFKRSDGIFADMYASSMVGSTGKNNIGMGALTSAVRQDFKHGMQSQSNNPLDMAVNGNGFFQVQLPNGKIAYSRNGQFNLDRNGYIEHPVDHHRLMGFPVAYVTNGKSVFAGDPQELRIDVNKLIEASPTKNVNWEMNLNSSELSPADRTPPGPAINLGAGVGVPAMPDPESYNGADSIHVYDSMGNKLRLHVYYRRQPGTAPMSPNWDVYARLETDINRAATPPHPNVPLTHMGTLNFDTSGRFAAMTPGAGITSNSPGHVLFERTAAELTTGGEPLQLDLDFSKVTQYGQKTDPLGHSQDGYTSGRFLQLEIADNGIVQAEYSNGRRVDIGQVALTHFANPHGLARIGDNLFTETYDSGEAVTGKPMSGLLGSVKSAFVEDSNVDLTKELVTLIVQQRNYQANAQSIRTQDTLLQTLVNLR